MKTGLSQCPEKFYQVIRQRLRFLKRGKVPAVWQGCPTLNIEEAFRPLTGKVTAVFCEKREAGRNRRRASPFFYFLTDPSEGIGM